MAVTLDPKVQLALGKLLSAGAVYASDKAEVLNTIEAALTTADAPHTKMLKDLRTIVSSWNALPDPPEIERVDPKVLLAALKDAGAFSMSDMTELFNLLKKLHQELKQGWLKDRLHAQQSKFAMANAEKATADKASDERLRGAIVSESTNMAGAVLSGGAGAVGLAKTGASVKKQLKAGQLEESVQGYKSAQEAGETLKKKMQNEIADLDAQLQAPGNTLTPKQRKDTQKQIETLTDKVDKLDRMMLDHKWKLGKAAGENELEAKQLGLGVSIDDQYSRHITALFGAIGNAFSSSGRMYGAVKTAQAEKLDAERNQMGSFRDMYASQEQGAERYADANGQACNECNSSLQSAIQSNTQTQSNIAKNYN